LLPQRQLSASRIPCWQHERSRCYLAQIQDQMCIIENGTSEQPAEPMGICTARIQPNHTIRERDSSRCARTYAPQLKAGLRAPTKECLVSARNSAQVFHNAVSGRYLVPAFLLSRVLAHESYHFFDHSNR
jgi:hypothetical protein